MTRRHSDLEITVGHGTMTFRSRYYYRTCYYKTCHDDIQILLLPLRYCPDNIHNLLFWLVYIILWRICLKNNEKLARYIWYFSVKVSRKSYLVLVSLLGHVLPWPLSDLAVNFSDRSSLTKRSDITTSNTSYCTHSNNTWDNSTQQPQNIKDWQYYLTVHKNYLSVLSHGA